MSQSSNRAVLGTITLLAAALIIAACGQATPTVIPTKTTAPTTKATSLPETAAPVSPLPTTNPTSTASPAPSQTPFPRTLDFYFLEYNPLATADIPIHKSIGSHIWDDEIPAMPIDGTPQFINHVPPAGVTPLETDLLVQAGCEVKGYYAECGPASPLQQFACSNIYTMEILFQQQADLALMGMCSRRTQDDEITSGDGIILSGCAFREKIGYLFQSGSAVLLVDNQEELRKRFAPIESASEAVSYAQLATGLKAQYDLAYEPDLLYLQTQIEDTRSEPADGGYRVNLYHRPSCSCEPYVFSVIILQIQRDGTIDWVHAEPFALTTGYSCAD